MNIIIGSDHAGFDLKDIIKKHLISKNYTVEDIGTYTKDSCDYPDIALNLTKKINNNTDLGILICGTGVGMSIAVNKFKNIRGALLYNTEETKLAKEHNNANVIIFSSRIFSPEFNLKLLDTFLNSKFSNEERHLKRIEKISLLK